MRLLTFLKMVICCTALHSTRILDKMDDHLCLDIQHCPAHIELENRLLYVEGRILSLEDTLLTAIDLIEGQRDEIETLKESNIKLVEQVESLEDFTSNLENDVAALEEKVLPGKVAATCQEHADRGQTENGVYHIRPSMEVEAFLVTCEFRTKLTNAISLYLYYTHKRENGPKTPLTCLIKIISVL